ncbi:LacI family DNA-binding transcriptional regulator [Frondihabitans australicus]|uniref:LacI family transcriptional regulator n=1 Tax=Frondihabitans australicus TaxID=386892 RepID=A0A495IL31_9MICO|nr:LacI family DNA-binding transcriptional regulator [Frondihabitans australicus]RKR75866.1 LacI family transcriptional regulator [Frondihabitans australicus]
MSSEQTSLETVGSRAINIQAVADAAGVSKTTVSHVISGKRPVSTGTRRKVERVMNELGFEPNFFAQAMQRSRSNTIALIVQDITNPFYPALARGLQTSVAAQNQVVLLFDAGAGEESTKAFVKDAIQRRVDGVVVASGNLGHEIDNLQRAGIALVAVGSGLSDLPIDWVSADDSRIASDAVRRLHELGHNKIAIIGGPQNGEPAISRLAGYRHALTDLRITVPSAFKVDGDWTTRGGQLAMQALLDADERPTAVFCANDLMAIGAMNALLAAGLRVPEDIALIGVDDIDASALVRPALSTVRVPAEEIGRAAGDLLLHRLAEGDSSSRRHVLVQHSLINRHSA